MSAACWRESSPLTTPLANRFSTAAKSWAKAKPSGSTTKLKSKVASRKARDVASRTLSAKSIENLLCMVEPPLIVLPMTGPTGRGLKIRQPQAVQI